MYRVVRNAFRKMSILWVNFITEDGICNPKNWFYLMILQNKDMVKIKAVVVILKILASFIVHWHFDNLIYDSVQKYDTLYIPVKNGGTINHDMSRI